MKSVGRVTVLVLLIVSLALTVSAQDDGPSLGDLARQERERRQRQSSKSGQADPVSTPAAEEGREAAASDVAGLKEGKFKANILITDSKAAIERWVLMPVAERPGAGRIREVTPGKRFELPVVVTDYPLGTPPKMALTAHITMIDPSGKTMVDLPDISGAIAPDPRTPGLRVLNPVLNITFDSTDLPGTYTVRATVIDHIRSEYAKTQETFELTQEQGQSGEPNKKPAAAPPNQAAIVAK